MISNQKPKKFLLQLFITSKCNQNCTYCYLDKHAYEPLMFEKFRNIIEDYIKILKKYSEINNIKCEGHVLITGGEPFLRDEFYPLLNLLYDNRDYLTYSVATNGTSISNETCFKLKAFKVSYVELALDGSRDVHDKLRYKGSFDDTIDALDILYENNLKTTVTFTASKENYKEFSKVCKICRIHNVSKIHAEKFVPKNMNQNLTVEECLNKEECKKYYKIIKRQQYKYLFNLLTTFKVYSDYHLKLFRRSDVNACTCEAGISIMTINDCGNIYPCKNLPINCGNVYDNSLYDVYFNNPIFKDLRKPNNYVECQHCKYFKNCNGGCKGLTYAILNNYKEPDPFCPVKKR